MRAPEILEESRWPLSARDRRLLVFGYPRRVTELDVSNLMRFLLDLENEEETEEEEEEDRSMTIKILDETDAHGCTAAFVQLPKSISREKWCRTLETVKSGVRFEGENIYLRTFEAPNRPEALRGLPTTIEEVFRTKRKSDNVPKGYTIGYSGSDVTADTTATNNNNNNNKRKRGGPGPLLSLSENVVDVVREGRRLVRAEMTSGGFLRRDFDAVEFLEFDRAMSKPGECERASVKLVGRRGNNNVERKTAVVYAAEALSFFIGSRGIAVNRMRNTFPTVAFECIEHPQKVVFLWQKGTGSNGDEEVAKCEEILFEKAVLETIETLQRTMEEYNSFSAKKEAPENTSCDFRSQRSSEDIGYFRTQTDSHQQVQQQQQEEVRNDDIIPIPTSLHVGKTPAPPSTANAYGHLYQDLDDKGEEEFENTNRILDNYVDDDNDDFGGEGIHGDDDSYEKEEDGTNVLPNTPSPTTELQDADADNAGAHENKDINSRRDVHRVCSEKLISRTDVAFVLGSAKIESGNITERFDLNERLVRVRMPKGKSVSESNYACGIVTKVYGEPGRTKLHQVTWNIVLDLGLESGPYTTDMAYLSNDSFTQTETSAFADSLKTRDGKDAAAEILFRPV